MTAEQSITNDLIKRVFDWLGRENVIWFKHVKGLKGKVDCILQLNYKKKHIPFHPIHLREGMQIRNYLRSQPECTGWQLEDFERHWVTVIEQCIKLL